MRLWIRERIGIVVFLCALLGTLAAPANGTGSGTERVRFQPEPISLSAPELANSMRGMYSWLGVPGPRGWPLRDVYYRDQVNWNRIERGPGQYRFDAFDRGLAEAGRRHGRFGFRVMAYSPGYGDDVLPAYLPRQPNGAPDWNAEEFLAAWEQLMGRLGERYSGDPRLGWVDVGGYGSWGEWHIVQMPPGTEPITTANARRMITAVLTAFPDEQVVINAGGFAPLALRLSERVGLRVDCLGYPGSMLSALPSTPALQRRWRTRPLIGEWCNAPETSAAAGAGQVRRWHFSMISSGNYPTPYSEMDPAERAAVAMAAKLSGYRYRVESVVLTGRLTAGAPLEIDTTWRNDGSAPTYDPWQPELVWIDAAGRSSAVTALSADLRTVRPGTRASTDHVTVPDLDPGRYRLVLRVRDPEGYLRPMRLAMRGRRGTGYLLGTLVINR